MIWDYFKLGSLRRISGRGGARGRRTICLQRFCRRNVWSHGQTQDQHCLVVTDKHVPELTIARAGEKKEKRERGLTTTLGEGSQFERSKKSWEL